MIEMDSSGPEKYVCRRDSDVICVGMDMRPRFFCACMRYLYPVYLHASVSVCAHAGVGRAHADESVCVPCGQRQGDAYFHLLGSSQSRLHPLQPSVERLARACEV